MKNKIVVFLVCAVLLLALPIFAQQFGQGWVPLFLPEDALAAGIALIGEAFAARGRDPATLQVRHQLFAQFDANGRLNLDATFAPVERLTRIGVTMVSLGLGWSIRDPADVEATIAAIGAWGRKHL